MIAQPLDRRPRGVPLPQISLVPAASWVGVEAQLPGVLPRPEVLLSMTAALAGPVKLCLSPAGRAMARLDVPLVDPDADRVRVAKALAEMRAALRALLGRRVARASATSPVVPDVSGILGSAGWACSPRDAGWVVPLGDAPRFCQAEVSLSGSAIRASLDLVDACDLSDGSREAVAALLLKACGSFRMVRASLPSAGPRRHFFLDVAVPFHSAAADLPEAVAALSVAALSTLREATALRDPRVAEAYLATSCHSAAGHVGRSLLSTPEC